MVVVILIYNTMVAMTNYDMLDKLLLVDKYDWLQLVEPSTDFVIPPKSFIIRSGW